MADQSIELLRRLNSLELGEVENLLMPVLRRQGVVRALAVAWVVGIALAIAGYFLLPALAIENGYLQMGFLLYLALCWFFEDALPGVRWHVGRLQRGRLRALQKKQDLAANIEASTGFLWQFCRELERFEILPAEQRKSLVMESRLAKVTDLSGYFRALLLLRQRIEAEKRAREYRTMLWQTDSVL